MSEPKWTPGPWKFQVRFADQFGCQIDIRRSKGKIVFTFVSHLQPSSARSTAHLIAAAPDLYEALQRIVKWMDAQGYNALYQDDTALKDARAALAKARGETAA